MADQNNDQVINLDIQLPEKEELPQQIRRLIATLEDLLGIQYPSMPPRFAVQSRRRPLLTEVSSILIAYHIHISPRAIAEDRTIYQWLRFQPENIPNLSIVLKKLQQPHIKSCMCINGLATMCLPNIGLSTTNPPLRIAVLTNTVNNYITEGDEKQVVLYEGKNILQGQLTIFTYTTLYTPFTSYHLRFSLGREDSLLQLPTAADAFNEPTDLKALYYNARGAALHSFRAHLRELIQEHKPMILIITETRLGAGEAYQVSNAIQYEEVITVNPTGYCGGIWIDREP
ncbi:hypothetical protein CCACVL1_30444 [Corchorus capsularis]|uniref:Endonuclease/exonuclease/phosphatase n=1 Tax=Corchorus capsularis TaxID=210143 RepID=A0A1R3FX34_COCAP|nr:hypothetical protein CCACVL1_30444 [Corchorus capsularis]